MSDPTNDAAVTWRTQVLKRSAGTLAAAIVLAGIGPAIANAAGADVANPVAVALKASGKGLAKAFGSADDGCASTPEPTESSDGTDGTDLDETASAEPTASPSDLPSLPPADDDDCEEAEETEESASPSASPTPSPTESEEAEEDGNHGQIVRTVAHCAPRGKDPLLDVEGAPSNHGGYVKVAAHGDTLTLPWGTYDLSTQAGADDLCASLEAARADLDEQDEDKKKKQKKAKRGKPARAGKGGRNK